MTGEVTGEVAGAPEYRREPLWSMFLASAVEIAGLRRSLALWLDQLGWPSEASEDIVLAVYEALANVVDHAYAPEHPPLLRQGQLYAWRVAEPATRARRVIVTVTDYGRWRPPDPGRGRYRGRGLALMHSCVHHVDLQPAAGGTTVILTSAPTAD